MATSGSTDWALNRDQLITVALRKLTVIPSGGTPSASQINDCVDSLQAIVKAFNADGMALWKRSNTTFNTVSGTSSYTIGTGSTISVPRPLKLLKALAFQSSTADGVPMEIETQYDFNTLPVTATGFPTHISYLPGRTTGTISLWPQPDSSTYQVKLYYQLPYEDMDSSTNDFDFPPEWMMAIIYNLAWVMAPEYGIPILDRKQLQAEADYWHAFALSMGSEEGSIKLQPDDKGMM